MTALHRTFFGFLLASICCALPISAQNIRETPSPKPSLELASLSSPEPVPQTQEQDQEPSQQEIVRAKQEMKEKMELLSAQTKFVTGKPYSATSATDVVQTLADGNHILHHGASVLYRDSQGRTRREQTFPGFDSGPGETKIFIDDPVSNTAFVLEPSLKTARLLSRSPRFLHELEAGSDTLADVKLPKLDERRDIVKDELGKKTIEGIECTGTRLTITIPAGQVGNERPIAIVTETWFSPAIAGVVQSSTADPRFGQTSYTLRNVELKDQPRTLFEPPAGYRMEK
jgi:hypothetical protein